MPTLFRRLCRPNWCARIKQSISRHRPVGRSENLGVESNNQRPIEGKYFNYPVLRVKVSQWRKITIIFERFIVLMWKNLNFQLFCFCYSSVVSVVNVGSAFTEAQLGSTLTALCFEIVYSLLRKMWSGNFKS